MDIKCEAQKSAGPFQMGRGMVNCQNTFTSTVTQLSDGDTMKLCTECFSAFKRINEGDKKLYIFCEVEV